MVARLLTLLVLVAFAPASPAFAQPLPPVTLPPEDMEPPAPEPPAPEPPAPPVPPAPPAEELVPDPPAAYGAPRATGNLIHPSNEQRVGLEPPAPGTPPGYPVCVEPRDDPEGAARRPTGDGTERCLRGLPELIELYTWAAVFALATGAFSSTLFGWDEGGGGPLILGTLGLAAGILGTYALDRRDGGLVPGVPASISTGLLVGFFEGLLFQASFLDPDAGPMPSLAGAILGGGLSTLLALHTEPTLGDALLVRTGAMWGIFFGFLLGFAATDFEEDDALPWILGGLNVGLGATMLLAREEDPSPLRVLWLNLGGLVGVFAGALMVAAAGDPELGPGHMAVWAIGTLGGLGITWMLTSDDDQAP